MAGIHGRSAQLKVSLTETAYSGVQLWPGGSHASVAATDTRIFQSLQSTQRDWKYPIKDRKSTEYGHPGFELSWAAAGDSSTAPDTYLSKHTRYVNMAGGAVHMGAYPTVTSGVFVQAISMGLSTVASILGDTRNYSLTVNPNLIDTTTLGEVWSSFISNATSWEGTLDGLYLDDFWFKKAIMTMSGITPTLVLRIRPDESDSTTYFQGNIMVSELEMNSSIDTAAERSVSFQGVGPLDEIKSGAPLFKLDSNIELT